VYKKRNLYLLRERVYERDSRTHVERSVTILKDTDEILNKSNDEADLKHKIT